MFTRMCPGAPIAILAVLGAALAAGCSDKNSTRPLPRSSPYFAATAPESLLANLETAYRLKDVAAYDSLIYDAGADAANVFVFEFADTAGAVTSWGRDVEICAARNMFTAQEVEGIAAHLTYGPSSADTLGAKTIEVSDVYLTINTRQDGGGLITYLIQGGRAEFRFKVQWVDAEGDSLWRIAYWNTDAGWGNVKFRYSTGCLGG